MGQVKETEEQDTGTGETYQASVQSPQDIKEQRDETEQQDTRTGEAYQDAPAPDAPQAFLILFGSHCEPLPSECCHPLPLLGQLSNSPGTDHGWFLVLGFQLET
uniref:Uncharacterized protein n=1 Tax=Oryza rufipogon TaxID=4529 RepID=A0A0E0QUK3_ORYRU